MAAAAARSPSPGPGRPCCAALRRSADSSPFKLADCTQRSSSVSKSGGGCGGCGCHVSPRRSLGEKENDPRDAAARTPKAARSCGGAKNFMAPTISAASKAVAASSASPRKKVLGERNEQQQHHLAAPSSPADHLALKPKGPPPPEAGATPTRRLRLSFDGVPAPAAVLEASHGSSRNSFAGDNARTENPVCKSHHHAAADPVDAEAEPSRAAAVYDPKTNYLSPRPRFLHYKPNPRIEMYRRGGGGGVRRLDEGFASESSDDDELTEEEPEQAQQKSEPCDLAAPSEAGDAAAAPPEALVLPPEPAPGSPPALSLTSEPAAGSPRVLTSEPRATSPRARAQTPEPELAANSARAPARKRSSLRFLLAAPLALILFMAAAFVCVPLPADSPLMTNAALWKVPDFRSSVQELHPVELAAWLKQWSSSSLDSITSYWEALVSTNEQEFLGPHFVANLSAAASDADHGADFYYNFAETWAMPSEEPVRASVLEEELKIQDIVSGSNTYLTAEPEADDVLVEEESIEDAAVEEESIEDAAVEEKSIDAASVDYYYEAVAEELDVEMSEGAPGINGKEMASSSQNLDIPSQPTAEPEQRDNLEDIESSLQQDVESDESKDDHADVKENQEAYHGFKSDSSMWLGYLDKISKPAAVVISIAVLILSTALVFLHMRQKQAQVTANANAPAVATNPNAAVEQAQQAETQSCSGSSEGHLLVKSSQFQSSVAEETERFGGSEVSQYSSSLSSGHARRRKNKEEESPSLEPMSKRESTTYSTSSYGSFTTYEKISAKKRNKEDEAMTPVRRSSRLRNVKSPEA